MPGKVLIVDDDPSICKMLQKVMTSNGLESETAQSGRQALLRLASEQYSIILMDINLEDMEGFDVIRKLRADGIHTPVIIISGRSEDYDALYGLSIGADDYITKPFRPVVLGAKVMALLRRSGQADAAAALTQADTEKKETDVLLAGPFRYELSKLRFYKNGQEIELSSRENTLMLLFLRHPDQVFTKDMIYEHVWGNTVIVDNNAIMVYINRLRHKIEDDPQNPKYIETVRGVGYRFRIPRSS